MPAAYQVKWLASKLWWTQKTLNVTAISETELASELYESEVQLLGF